MLRCEASTKLLHHGIVAEGLIFPYCEPNRERDSTAAVANAEPACRTNYLLLRSSTMTKRCARLPKLSSGRWGLRPRRFYVVRRYWERLSLPARPVWLPTSICPE